MCTLKTIEETGSRSGRQMQWEVQIIISRDIYKPRWRLCDGLGLNFGVGVGDLVEI